MNEPQAAVAIVHAQAPDESVLLIRRADREDDPWSGHWSFPGGRRDPGDADLLDTALRELEEECGVRLMRADMESPLAPAVARRQGGKFITVAPFVFRVPHEMPVVLDAREAAGSLWVPLRLLRDPGRHYLQPAPRLPHEMRFPAIGLNGAPLWGFTYRLITHWLRLLPEEHSRGRAGFEAASLVLDFLLSQGVSLESGWEEEWSGGPGEPVKVARVKGAIPVSAVTANFCRPSHDIPPFNLLEIRPDYVRLAGLDFEEYLIRATG